MRADHVEPVASPLRTHDQPQGAGVAGASSPDGSLEQDDDGKYVHGQPRPNETEYAALQRTVVALQHTLLRLSEGQQVVAQQMQHDFTQKLQLAQMNFTQQLSAVQVSKNFITPLGLIRAVGSRCKVAV